MQGKKKKSYDVSQKCQEFWTLKFPWVEMIQGKVGGVHHVHYLCCSNVHKKDLFLAPQLDKLKIHVGKTKVLKNLPHLGIKHGGWYINKHYLHLKNEFFKKGNQSFL